MKLYEEIKGVMKKLIKDYDNNMICHEGAFESAFYMHLRQAIKLWKDNKIWTQVKLKNQENQNMVVDVALVTMQKVDGKHLKNCISRIDALIEIKYVQMSGDALDDFKDSFDVKKVSNNLTKVAMAIKNDVKKMISLKERCTTMDNKTSIRVGEIYCIGCIENTSDKYKPWFFIIKDGKEIYPIE